MSFARRALIDSICKGGLGHMVSIQPYFKNGLN